MGNITLSGTLPVTLLIASCLALPVLAETESSKARGGKLYDKWYAVVGAEAPATSHPLYPSDKNYAQKPKANWRCKECHGWDYMGADVPAAVRHSLNMPEELQMFQQLLFSKIVPNCKKLGLLDRNEAWLRRRFEEMGVIQFEDWETTDNDFENFTHDEVVSVFAIYFEQGVNTDTSFCHST